MLVNLWPLTAYSIVAFFAADINGIFFFFMGLNREPQNNRHEGVIPLVWRWRRGLWITEDFPEEAFSEALDNKTPDRSLCEYVVCVYVEVDKCTQHKQRCGKVWTGLLDWIIKYSLKSFTRYVYLYKCVCVVAFISLLHVYLYLLLVFVCLFIYLFCEHTSIHWMSAHETRKIIIVKVWNDTKKRWCLLYLHIFHMLKIL